MRKRLIKQNIEPHPSRQRNWLNLDSLTEVELTSEDTAYPIEAALIAGSEQGWRAAQPGAQTIRLIFNQPQHIQHIRLLFIEENHERTQQFTLRWSGDGAQTYQEITRQQYNFNPADTTREVEEYQVELDGVTTLELNIIPDISGSDAIASLEQLQLA